MTQEIRHCERCNREIKHRGRCLPCNYFYKHKKYYPGLRESPEYDIRNGINPDLVKQTILESSKLVKKSDEVKSNKETKRCRVCEKTFEPKRKEYLVCYKCFKFFQQFGGINNYGEFLEAFDLDDNQESKDNYIEFVDKLRVYKDVQGIWAVDEILKNPGKFLDKVKTKKS